MENNHFWAFFIIALIAGASIAFAIGNASMTGYFTWPWQKAPAVATPIAPTMNVTGCGAYTCVPEERLNTILEILGCYVQCESNANVKSCVDKCIGDYGAALPLADTRNMRDCSAIMVIDSKAGLDCIVDIATGGIYVIPNY